MEKTEPHGYRPALHFTAPAMWLNDPNGLVCEGGRYHLFYQHNPAAPVWGPMHWGHAVSADLLHWEHLPVALYPDRLGTIFSGCAILDEKNDSGLGQPGRPPLIALYTSHGESEQQSLAYSLDGGRSFQKYPGNPVIKNPGLPDFRDPKVFQNPVRGGWSMVVSAHDRVHFYFSRNLLHWEKTGEFGLAENLLPGAIWECPDLFPLCCGGEEYWVLLASMILPQDPGGPRTRYFLGRFDGDRFLCNHPFPGPAWIDGGFDNYAGSTYAGTAERIFLGWSASPAYAQETPTAPFRGQMTLPRTVSLRQTPLSGIRLAFSPRGLKGQISESRALRDGMPLSDTLFALQISAEPGCEIALHNALGERLLFGLDRENRLWCDRSQASRPFGEAFHRPVFQRMSAPRFFTGECPITAVFDACSLELYADGGTRCFTALAYPTRPYERIAISGASGEYLSLRP